MPEEVLYDPKIGVSVGANHTLGVVYLQLPGFLLELPTDVAIRLARAIEEKAIEIERVRIRASATRPRFQ